VPAENNAVDVPTSSTPIALVPVKEESSSSSSSSDGEEEMEMVTDRVAKRGREDDDGEDEAERCRTAVLTVSSLRDGQVNVLTSLVSALVSPHEAEDNDLPLHPDEVQEARSRELDSLIAFDVYEEVNRDDYKGIKPISMTWVDRRRGSQVKSRLCAREFKTRNDRQVETYAATPTPIGVRIIDMLASCFRLCVALADVSSAFLHAEVESDLIILVDPPEEARPRESRIPHGRMVWKLKRWLYGLRGAPQAWQLKFSSSLLKLGFKQCVVDPCLFYHCEQCIYLVVHVDDIYCCGPSMALTRFLDDLKLQFSMKYQGPYGPGSEFVFLGCRRALQDNEMTLRFESNYVTQALSDMGMTGCKPATVPWTSRKAAVDEMVPLNDEETHQFRSATGKLMYVAHLRPDVQWSVRKLACAMRSPTVGDRLNLKHVLRYMAGTLHMALVNPIGNEHIFEVCVYTDSDWASSTEPERKSVSGGLVIVNGCVLSSWSKGQSLTALSSGEAEYYSLTYGVGEGLFVQTILGELGFVTSVRVMCDSSAAIGMASRRGSSSRTRHIEARYYYLQQLVATRLVSLVKIPGVDNIADILTKGLSAEVVRRLSRAIGLRDDSIGDEKVGSLFTQGTSNSKAMMMAALTVLMQMVQCSSLKADNEAQEISDDSNVFMLLWSLACCLLGAAVGICIGCRCCRRHALKVSVSSQVNSCEVTSSAQPGVSIWIAPKCGKCFHLMENCPSTGHASDMRMLPCCKVCLKMRQHNDMQSPALVDTTLRLRGRV
jgi:hypothetical protein